MNQEAVLQQGIRKALMSPLKQPFLPFLFIAAALPPSGHAIVETALPSASVFVTYYQDSKGAFAR